MYIYLHSHTQSATDDVDIGTILQEHAQKVCASDIQRINIRRSHLLDDAISSVQKATFCPGKTLKVRFIGEPAVDDGGPRREFFHLFYNSMSQASSMFQILPNECGISLNHNIQALAAEKFAACGKIIALGLLQGSEAPHCFCKEVSDFLVYGAIKDPECAYMLKSIPNSEISGKLNQVSIEELYSCEYIQNIIIVSQLLLCSSAACLRG